MSVTVRRFRRSDEAALRRVMAAAVEADRYPGFNAWDSDQEASSIVGFADGTPGSDVVEANGVVCGYVSQRHVDLTVHPAHRRRGYGRLLLAAGLRQAAAAGEAELTLYAPAEGPGHDFAVAMGMTHRSSEWRMDLPSGVATPPPSFPPEVAARGFGDWIGLDEYVALLNEAFADHPTSISWTVDSVAYAHARPDFDPAGILLLCPESGDSAEAGLAPGAKPARPIGFVRSGLGPPEEGDPRPVGEVRIVGVLREWRGRGLGRELLLWGVAHARERGAGRIKLTVEGTNAGALRLYRAVGFEPVVEWPQWTLPVTARVPGLEE